MKTFLPKEKLLQRTKFSFYHNVFKRHLLHICRNVSVSEKGFRLDFNQFVIKADDSERLYQVQHSVHCSSYRMGVWWIGFNPFPHNDDFWSLCRRRLLKTLCQKEKVLKTSNFLIATLFLTLLTYYTSIYVLSPVNVFIFSSIIIRLSFMETVTTENIE